MTGKLCFFDFTKFAEAICRKTTKFVQAVCRKLGGKRELDGSVIRLVLPVYYPPLEQSVAN
jgi:hypothetical protein